MHVLGNRAADAAVGQTNCVLYLSTLGEHLQPATYFSQPSSHCSDSAEACLTVLLLTGSRLPEPGMALKHQKRHEVRGTALPVSHSKATVWCKLHAWFVVFHGRLESGSPSENLIWLLPRYFSCLMHGCSLCRLPTTFSICINRILSRGLLHTSADCNSMLQSLLRGHKLCVCSVAMLTGKMALVPTVLENAAYGSFSLRGDSPSL